MLGKIFNKISNILFQSFNKQHFLIQKINQSPTPVRNNAKLKREIRVFRGGHANQRTAMKNSICNRRVPVWKGANIWRQGGSSCTVSECGRKEGRGLRDIYLNKTKSVPLSISISSPKWRSAEILVHHPFSLLF